MGAGAQVGGSVVAHGAKAGQGRLQADAQVAEEGFHKDGRGDQHGQGDQDGAHGVGDQMLEQDGLGGGADGLGGKNEFLLLEAQHLAADNAGHVHPVNAAQSHDDALDTVAHDLHDEDDVQRQGDGGDNVHDTHHDGIHHAAHITGHAAVQDADDHVDQGGHKGHHQGDAGAVHQAGEDITAQGVGAQQVGGVPHHLGGVDVAGGFIGHHAGAAAVV